MKDGEHDDFVVLLANFVDDDIGAFDEFVGPGIETEAAHSSETRGEEQFELAENPIYQPLCGCRVVFCDPVKNILKIAQRVFLEDEPHSLERATLFHLCERHVFRIPLCPAAPQLGELLLGQPIGAGVLRLHF